MSIYDIRRLQDIQLEDVLLKQQYYDEFFQGHISNARDIVTQNPQLHGKVLNAENLNKLITNILAEEQKFYINSTDIMTADLQKFQLNIDNLIYIDEYSPSVKYNKNNFFTRFDDMYYCFGDPPIGTQPTDTNYFIYLGLKGINGYEGLDVKYIGQWSSTVNYAQKDMVVYQDKIYVANVANINKNPTNSSNTYGYLSAFTYGVLSSQTYGQLEGVPSWDLCVSIENQTIFISSTEPPNLKNGQLWLKII